MSERRRKARLHFHFMTISLHSHSGQFCSHAVGTLEEVVQEAVRQGFSTFGLSEHIPRYRIQDLYPEEVSSSRPRIRTQSTHDYTLQIEHGVEALAIKFEEYVVEANRLKYLYEPQIKLLVGIETEYINEEGLDRLEQLLERHGDSIQYIVGSVHHCSERPIDFDKAQFDSVLATLDGISSTDRFSQLFEIYFDNQLKLMQRLKPAVIGHFDLCRLYYPELDFRSFPVVWEKIQRNVEYASSYGALFEINSSAFRKGWSTAYPGVEVFDVSRPRAQLSKRN